ncbi:MAG: hypothetical protein ACE5NG_18915, partial [bacterium]
VLVLGTELFIDRFWCRYLCAVGAALGVISKISIWKIKTNASCEVCNKCLTACQVRAKTKRPDGWLRIDTAECIGCDEHVRDCPRGILVLRL